MNELQQAITLLLKGDVIILPVEGTYCFVADPFNEKAIAKLNALKLHQQVKAKTIIAVGDLEDLPRFVNGFSDTEEQAIMQNWPSDVSIAFSSVQQGVNSSLLENKKIILRIPSTEYVLEVLHAIGQPLATVTVYNQQMPAKDKYDLRGLENFVLKLPNSLSGKESKIID